MPGPASDILISGLGIAGPTLAYWLRKRGFRPVLVERAPAPRRGGYIIDFWGVGYDVADRMGLLPALHREACHLDEVRLVDTDGRRVARLRAAVFGQATGGRYLSILRSGLARQVWDLVDGSVETIFGDSVTRIEQDADSALVHFEHAPPRRFGLVIGADGLHSNIRSLAFDPSAPVQYHLGCCTAALTARAYPRRDTGVYVSYAAPGIQAARYALADGASTFFFIFVHKDPDDIPHHDAEAQKALVRRAFAGRGWECDQMLAEIDRTDDWYFDAVAQVRIPQWHRGRVALVGDAAYCPSLLAGQGSALAMAGAYVLAYELERAAGDHATAFARYQARFKPFIDSKQRAAEHFTWWMAPQTRLGVHLRNFSTRLMDLPIVAAATVKRSFGDPVTLPD
ncbi:MAG TPA: FAD-binding domain [Gemmatimonadales bacterium]|nr:FAD-binding domain [Gemmatimonadales bacterium]